MSASYFGTFPVTRVLSDVVSADGVRILTVSEMHQESNAAAAVPAVHSAYSGDANLSVTQANVTYTGNGLAEVVYSVAGPAANPPVRVQITPGGPLIFGLAPGVPPAGNGLPNWSASGGQAVEAMFVTTPAEQSATIETYYRNPMPSGILGQTLPEPARSAGPITGPDANVPGPSPFPQPLPPGSQPEFIGHYNGFVCVEAVFQRQGNALLARLIFKETGWLQARTAGGYREIFFFN